MSNTLDYQCPSCGAPLSLDPSSGQIVCANCGNKYKPEDIEALQKAEQQEGSFSWAAGQQTAEREKLENMTVYHCQNCGAIIECDENTVATHCPYCDNNVIIGERAEGGLKPNAIVPFEITTKELPDAINRFYGNKKLLPRNFFSASRLSKVQGIYIPFWMFKGTAEGTAMFSAERIRHYTQGNYDCTETSHYRLIREGSLSFKNVGVDASTKMDDDLMDSLEPYDLSKMVPFKGAYLTGYLADRYDSSPEAELERAEKRMRNTASSAFASTTGGYTSVMPIREAYQIRNAEADYVMLPVYLVNNEYDGKKYQYAINGQTGKVIGELPVSKERVRHYFLITMGVVFAAVFGLVCLL